MKLKRKPVSLIKILFMLFFLHIIYLIPLQNLMIHAKSSPINVNEVQMLVFVSPQYSGDISVLRAIEEYSIAVKDDIGWNIKIITLTNETNSVGYIRFIIREHYHSSKILAAIVVGEDTDTPLDAEKPYIEVPSVCFWSELDEPIYLSSHANTTGKWVQPDVGVEELNELLLGTWVDTIAHKPDVCVSLIYPTAEWSYEEKRVKLITTFQKFSDRASNYEDDILFIVNGTLHSSKIWSNFAILGNVSGKIDGVRDDWMDAYGERFKLIASLGHGNPRSADVLRCEDLQFIYTPCLVVGGCHTAGWYSNVGALNNVLDPSISGWFGELILTHPALRVIIAGNPWGGVLSYGGPVLAMGETVAEAWIDRGPYVLGQYGVVSVSSDNMIVYGDPTFHFPDSLSLVPRTLRVPTDYPTIENALDMAKPGDTIFVCNGIYKENIMLNTNNITLLGENPDLTIIDGNYSGDVVSVSGNDVKICNFTIKNSGSGKYSGINIISSDIVVITRNKIINCHYGILDVPFSGKNYMISKNKIMNCGFHGIHIWGKFAIIYRNLIYNNNGSGISLGSNYNTISQNEIIDNDHGGLNLYNSSHNNIIENDIIKNEYDLLIQSTSYNNSFYHNNFINNKICITFEDATFYNKWDTGYPSGGNFWSSYPGMNWFTGSYQNETGCDSIGDAPCFINENNQDNYPLVSPLYIAGENVVKVTAERTQRCDVREGSIEWTGRYLENNETPGGVAFLNDTFPKDRVGRYNYRVIGVLDSKDRLCRSISNNFEVIFDQVTIVDGGVSRKSNYIGRSETVWFKAVYEYDSEVFDGSKGLLYVNREPMEWSSERGRWEKEYTSNSPQKVLFKVTGIADDKYGLKTFNNTVVPPSIEWKKGWITEFTYMSILLTVIVVVCLLWRRARMP